ncbi:MAG: OpgC domain-containing protein [Planctomycetaceae bacterium]
MTSATDATRVPRRRALAALAGAIVLYGMVSASCTLLVGLTGISDPHWLQWVDLSTSWLTAKTTLGPLRFVHFAAVAYLLAYWVTSWPPNWSSPWLRPVVVSGRHSLAVFCCGSVMVYAAAIPFYRFGNDPWVVAGVGLFACLAQLAVAAWLERRARKSDLPVPQFEAAMT